MQLGITVLADAKNQVNIQANKKQRNTFGI